MEICESDRKEAQSLQILLITSLAATYLYVSYKISNVSKQRCISQVNSFSAKGEQQKLYMLLTCCVRQHTRQSHLISPPTKQNNLKSIVIVTQSSHPLEFKSYFAKALRITSFAELLLDLVLHFSKKHQVCSTAHENNQSCPRQIY